MLDTIGLGDLNILQVIRLLCRITRGERTEREDTYEAVCQLAEVAPFAIEEEKITQWFDKAREF